MSTNHRRFNQARWAFAAFLAIASLLSAGLSTSPAHASPVPQPTVSGWLTILWGDSSGEHGASQTVYQFTADSGYSTVLQIDDALARSLGGMLPFDRKHVIVTTDSALGPS